MGEDRSSFSCLPPADRNFKGPFYTLDHVRYRLRGDTGVLERGLGSVSGASRDYADAARDLAQAIVERDCELVYGGANVGLMGVVADRVLELGGRAVGVIPKALVEMEVAHPSLSELHIVESMHARKAMMTDLSSAFVALPGGLGTLEETFEVLTRSQLGMHSKPVGLLNVAGDYDGLIEFLDRAVTERFLKPEHRELLLMEERAGALLSAFSRYRAVKIGKWIERTET